MIGSFSRVGSVTLMLHGDHTQWIVSRMPQMRIYLYSILKEPPVLMFLLFLGLATLIGFVHRSHSFCERWRKFEQTMPRLRWLFLIGGEVLIIGLFASDREILTQFGNKHPSFSCELQSGSSYFAAFNVKGFSSILNAGFAPGYGLVYFVNAFFASFSALLACFLVSEFAVGARTLGHSDDDHVLEFLRQPIAPSSRLSTALWRR